MKALIARRLVLAIFATSMAVGGIGLAPITAGACGWYVERQNSASESVYDDRSGWTYAVVIVQTYNDGCGNKKYYSEVYSANGLTTDQSFANVRVWVCGTYQGSWNSPLIWNGTYAQVWSPSFYYGGCGRQADDYNTGMFSYDWSPNQGVQYYINQG
jgi:hypothetical protein